MICLLATGSPKLRSNKTQLTLPTRRAMENERYRNDPITEALLEIRIVTAKEMGPAGLREVFACLSGSYTVQGEILSVRTEASFGEKVSAAADQKPSGIVLIGENGKQKIEARQDAFVYGQLAPYPGWEAFQTEARRIWSMFRPYAQPEQIPQIGLRFINRFHFPFGSAIDKYLRIFPVLSEDLLEKQRGFFLQTRMVWPEYKAVSVVNEATVDPAIPNHSSVLLDIDTIRAEEISAEDNELWGLISDFRKVKNKIFESLITDETRRALRQ